MHHWLTASRLCILIALSALLLTACEKEISPEQRQADSTYARATEQFERGNFTAARVLLRQSYALDGRLGRHAQMADEQRLLAMSYQTTANFDSAIEYYSRAHVHYKEVADRRLARAMTIEIARIHVAMGEERIAHDQLTESLRLARIFDDMEGVREIQWAMLATCRALGRIDEEQEMLAELLDRAAEEGDERSQARLFMEFGEAAMAREDYNEALQQYLRSLSTAEQNRDSVLGIEVLIRIAQAYDRSGQPADAFQTLGDALKRADLTAKVSELREEMLVRVGNMYLRRRLFDDAARFYRAGLNAALRSGNKVGEGYLLLQLGHCAMARPGSASEALNNYNNALALFEGLGYTAGEAYALLSLAFARREQRAFVEAARYSKLALEKLESTSWVRSAEDLYADCESGFFASISATWYELHIELLLELGRYEEAFWYTERWHGYRLFHALSRLEPETDTPALSSALAQFRHTKSLRTAAEKQYQYLLSRRSHQRSILAEARDNLVSYGTATGRESEKVAQMRKSLEPFVRIRNMGMAEVQRLVGRGVALVTHFPAQKSVYSFVASESRAAVQIAAAEKGHVLSQARELKWLLAQRQLHADSSTARKHPLDVRIQEISGALYGVFIRPIEKDLVGTSKVLIVPGAGLEGVPFHALRKPLGRSFVAEQFLVSYLPSSYAMLYKPVQSRQPAIRSTQDPIGPSIAGIGHPGETLWDVEYELRDIRAFQKEARLYFGQQATLASVKAERADVLHIAAQFAHDKRDAGNSFFVLADGKAIDTWRRILWGEFVSVPGFPTVVVSDLSGGGSTTEPVFPFVLLQQGCGSIVTNSYGPARKTKKYFTELFYTALVAGASAQNAMRVVQTEMIKNREFAEVSVWAPFFLWGR